MSTDVKISLAKAGVVAGVISAVVALFGAWFVLPYRMAAAEAEIVALKVKVESQSTLLIRIDENVKALKESTAARRD